MQDIAQTLPGLAEMYQSPPPPFPSLYLTTRHSAVVCPHCSFLMLLTETREPSPLYKDHQIHTKSSLLRPSGVTIRDSPSLRYSTCELVLHTSHTWLRTHQLRTHPSVEQF